MKSLSQLARTSHEVIDLCRAKRVGVDMMMRKQYRRAKKINYFSRQYTNQSNPNAWFNTRKYKALVAHYQEMRNLHRGSNPISPQHKKQIAQKFTEDSHWQYWAYRNFLKQFNQNKELLNSVDIKSEIATMPAKLREEVQKLKDDGQLPQMIQEHFHFSEQYQVCLPQDEKYRRNLLLKIDNPPRDKSQEEEED